MSLDAVTLIRSLIGAPAPDSFEEKTLVTAANLYTSGDVDSARNILMYAPIETSIKQQLLDSLQNAPTSPNESLQVTAPESSPELVVPTSTSETVTSLPIEDVSSNSLATQETSLGDNTDTHNTTDESANVIDFSDAQNAIANQGASTAVPIKKIISEQVPLGSLKDKLSSTLTVSEVVTTLPEAVQNNSVEQILQNTTTTQEPIETLKKETSIIDEVLAANPDIAKNSPAAQNDLASYLIQSKQTTTLQKTFGDPTHITNELVSIQPLAANPNDVAQVLHNEISNASQVVEVPQPASAVTTLSEVTADKTQAMPVQRNEIFDNLFTKADKELHPAPVVRDEIPNVIHTYDTTDEDNSQKKENEYIEKHDADKASEYFRRAEEYLKKAFTISDPSLIKSATNQFASLRKRYPSFEEVYPERITEIEEYIKSQTLQSVPQVDIGGVLIKHGMTITSSSKKRYVVSDIQKSGAGYVFFFKESDVNYLVPEVALTTALSEDALDPDEFFEEFRQG